MEQQVHTIYASARDGFMAGRGAKYSGQNAQGALVYVAKLAGGGTITYVVTGAGQGLLRVREIRACAC